MRSYFVCLFADDGAILVVAGETNPQYMEYTGQPYNIGSPPSYSDYMQYNHMRSYITLPFIPSAKRVRSYIIFVGYFAMLLLSTQNRWVSGLCPHLEFYITRKRDVSETGSVFFLR
jgi:hypothetical protein